MIIPLTKRTSTRELSHKKSEESGKKNESGEN